MWGLCVPDSPLTISLYLYYSLIHSVAHFASGLALFRSAWSRNSLSQITLNLKQLSQQFRALSVLVDSPAYAQHELRTSLPGIALAQRTTVTSCLSPSSLRLVSKDAGLSGWAWSCPALTTAGSMVCKTLSRDRQERRVGGMPRARAWDAEEQEEEEYKTTIGVFLFFPFTEN